MLNQAVIGLGFGDEGKGLMTDYLCSNLSTSEIRNSLEDTIVVRYSGGQQAGHTVCLDDQRHIFSNFGSGTLRGIPTYWSKYCSVDPTGICNELDVLKMADIMPILYIDPRAPVTTPFDKYHNQNSEKMLDNGTCGCGVGSTFQREEDFYHLQFKDLLIPSVLELKLQAIEDHYGFNIDLTSFLSECKELRDYPYIGAKLPMVLERYNIIFEGSQGLLLDQYYGFFPHVTRSNTGTKNIVEMGYNPYLYLVTRAYQTRHGNGPMTLEDKNLNIEHYPYETNIDNEFQGKFRKTILDLDLISHGIKSDSYIRDCLISDQTTLVITCMDQLISPFKFKYEEEIHTFDNKHHFISKISSFLGVESILVSNGPEAKDIEKF